MRGASPLRAEEVWPDPAYGAAGDQSPDCSANERPDSLQHSLQHPAPVDAGAFLLDVVLCHFHVGFLFGSEVEGRIVRKPLPDRAPLLSIHVHQCDIWSGSHASNP